jgi:oligosaccharide repeat unit polymerase
MLMAMSIPFQKYKFKAFWSERVTIKVSVLLWFVIIFGSFSLVTNIFVLQKVLFYITENQLSSGWFKYEDNGATLKAQLFPSGLISLANLGAAISYIAIPLFFYCYLMKKNKLAFLLLISSLSYPVFGLASMTRFPLVHFIISYFFTYVLVRGLLEKKRAAVLKILISLTGLFLLILFIGASMFRFGDSGVSEFNNDTNFDSPLIASTYSYATQHIKIGGEVLKNYELTDFWNGRSTLSLIYNFASFFGIDGVSLGVYREEAFGEYASSFTGLVPVLVYDLTISGSIIFVFIFGCITISCGQGRLAVLTLPRLLVFPFLISIPAFAFSGNILASFVFPYALLFTVISIMYLKCRF